MIKLINLILLTCILLSQFVSANEFNYAKIGDFCKKYQVYEKPMMLECMMGRCDEGYYGVEIAVETIIGKSIDKCKQVEGIIKFEGKAYIENYTLLINSLKCIVFKDCSSIEIPLKFEKPKDFNPLPEYQIIKVIINQPSRNGNGDLEIDIKDKSYYYRVRIIYSNDIIYKVNIVYLIKE